MSKLMYEIELSIDGILDYIYIETDDDLDIDFGVLDQNPTTNITHVTVIDTNIGMNPDLIISRRVR